MSDFEGSDMDDEEERMDAEYGRRYVLNRRFNCVKCKATDHSHENCPQRNKCYLCGSPKHRAEHCDHQLSPEAQKAALQRLLAERKRESFLYPFLRGREKGYIENPCTLQIQSPRLDDAIVTQQYAAVTAKRVTAISYHPYEKGLLFVGDKRGILNIFNTEGLKAGTVGVSPDDHANACFCQINEIVHDSSGNSVFVSSSDGRIQRVYCERGVKETNFSLEISDERFDVNPYRGDHWDHTCKMLYGLAFDAKGNKGLYFGDSDGRMHVIDPRASSDDPHTFQAHKKRNKVTHIHLHPLKPHLMVSGSNDYFVKMWDTRRLGQAFSLGKYKHGGVVSCAYFSPNTGSKLLTTSHDNRFQIWNDISVFGATSEEECAPDATMVHSHNFFRYLSPFRGVWDPRDWRDDLFMCGRYSEEVYKGRKVYPLDFFSAEKQESIASLYESDFCLRSPLNVFSPLDDSIASGPSRHVYIWRPKKDRTDKDEEDIQANGREDDSSKTKSRKKLKITAKLDSFRRVPAKK